MGGGPGRGSTLRVPDLVRLRPVFDLQGLIDRHRVAAMRDDPGADHNTPVCESTEPRAERGAASSYHLMPIRLRISSVGNDPATVASTCESSSAHRRQRSDEARRLPSLILRDPDRDAGRHQKGPLTSVVVRNGHPATSRCVRSDGLHGELGGRVVQPDPQVRTIMQASHGTAPSFDLRARYVARRPTAWKPPEMTSTTASVRALRRQSSRTAISHRERMPYRPIKPESWSPSPSPRMLRV